MGSCCSSDDLTAEERQQRAAEKAKSKQLEQKMTEDHSADQQINKLLLLGAGESGKSTLFKQMIQIYGKGFPESERKSFTNIIYNNIITSMKTLCQQSDQYGAVDPENDGHKRLVDELKGDEEIDEKLGESLIALWNDKGIQATFEQRSNYQLTDSTKYFLDRLDDVMRDNYIPTEQDVLRSRVRTTGIVENEFVIDGNQFKMYDVGGQRNERKKWIHCFEGVTAVLFVAAISEYDQTLFEDSSQNRMSEALTLFEEMCNSKYFEKSSMILFLNKRDLFAEKIKKVDLSVCFSDYKAGPDERKAALFIQEKFLARNHKPTKMKVFCHITCATDADNVKFTFNAVRQTIIDASLVRSGLQ